MPLNPTIKGLRPIFNKSNVVAKVDLRIAAGDILLVSDDVADQLIAARNGLVEGSVAPIEEAPPVAEAPAKPAAKASKAPKS